MKKYLLLCIILLTVFAYNASAAIVGLEWQRGEGGADPLGYEIYMRDYTSPIYNYAAPIWAGTETSCQVNVPDDKQVAFVARAWCYGAKDLEGNQLTLWSVDSEVVTYTPVVEPPAAPKNFIQRIIQALMKWLRNWRA